MRKSEFSDAKERLLKGNKLISWGGTALYLTLILMIERYGRFQENPYSLKSPAVLMLVVPIILLVLAFLLHRYRVRKFGLLCSSCSAQLLGFDMGEKLDDDRCTTCGNQAFSE